ncbi:MAG: hypothetical protein RI900_1138 [Actinomycetota bacterium]|jgi:hypothetical protein
MTASDDDAAGLFDPTPLEATRPGAWVESEAELFDRERRAMEAEIEAARSRAAGARERLAAKRDALAAALAADAAASQRELAQLEATHAEALQGVEADATRRIDELFSAAQRDASAILREVSDEGGAL